MKIKSLLMGMAAFLGFALAGCSDEVIDVNNQEQQVSNEPAYLTVTFSGSSTSSRSTADDANNQGDKDGNAEHSGHENLGTANENAINSALIVIQSTNGASGYTKLYEFGTGEGKSKLEATTVTNNTKETIYTLAEDIELSANPFDVLVVANPNENIYNGLTAEQIAEVKGTTGSRKDDIIAQLFTKIKDGSYAVAENKKALYNYAGKILDITGTDGSTTKTLNGIMMTNKANCNVTLSSTATNVATVELERVASKITYRHYGAKKTDDKYEIVAAPSTNESFYQDVYPITAPIAGTVEPITYENTDAQGKTITINEATITNENNVEETIYVTVNEGLNKITGIYTKSTTEDGSITWTKDENTTLPNYDDVTFKANYEETTWFVKLEDYALVNLSKSVYNVRHTTYDGSYVPFGVLNGSNFLYTPNWEAGINNVTFKNGAFDNIENTDSWFFNTLKQVSEESLKTEQSQYFTAFTSILSGVNDKQEVTGDGTYKENEEEKHQHSTTNNNLSGIGELLAYCLENSTDIDHQTHGLSTGITFKAKICANPDGSGTIGTFYRFQGHLFQTIKEIQDAYSEVYSNLSNLDENSTAEDLKKVGVSKYSDGTCYYYTTEIKHYDNNDPLVLGNMEFAIMRNNIYSLAVKKINVVGDPYVDPIPSTPDEIAKPKLTVEAKIMPWIVRYHDIEFN